ncbi:hypothetical protein FGG08_001765 [Glutinoglossum americanum]|uniref:Uncharacterized protein n=1 Tax=Glutinoglossum americanum TaxID=1670608 RepID=A0A9P8I7P0_9PEZI|nr:hypothetical protein FGG08_001765 [Glutinoglossum americanum]
MVLPIGIDTPRSEFGNATSATNLGELDISQEQSFQSPSRGNNDLVKQIQNSRRGITLKTPRSRMPFGDRHNILAPQGEFTPLLKSVTKSNLLRNQGKQVTPGFMRRLNVAESPALPAESSGVYEGDNTENSYEGNGHDTPVPQMVDSSAASTPLAMLPRREGGGVLADGAASMTLKEQENIINKIEKENFGLKLKIHFLEDALRKSGPGYSEAALRENTELKVDKVTMQKELHRYRKTLGAAERDLEQYRQQILEIQERAKRKYEDDGLREELERLRGELDDTEAEAQELRERLEKAEQREDVEALKENISDLEADLREKDRVIEEREDEIDSLREKAEQASSIPELEQQLVVMREKVNEYEGHAQASGDQAETLEMLQEELAESREKISDLEENLDRFKDEVEEAKEDRLEALEGKERAEANLNELREEMANKSFSTKGLSRQLEEKARRIQDELESLREENVALKGSFDDKVREVRKAQESLEEVREEGEIQEQKLRNDLELTQHERDVLSRERSSLSTQLQKLLDELKTKAEEKNLLQDRYNALTLESSGLQKELSQANATINELETRSANEKQLGLNNERALRDELKAASDHLNEVVNDLQRQLEEEERRNDTNLETWGGERRKLEAQRDKAEEKAAGLERTIAKLQEAEGTLSGREIHLREALASEKARHEREEAILSRRTEELQADIETRRGALEEARSENSAAKEELRVCKREGTALEEKVQCLEDEIEILQEENERATEDVEAARTEAEVLRRQLHSAKQDLTRAEAAQADAKADIETFRGEVLAGEGSKEHLNQRLSEAEVQLGKVKKEKQALQDQLANANIQMHTLRNSAAETEAERDEIRSQLQHAQQHQDVKVKLDQEKLELRRANARLETDISRAREESNALQVKSQELEEELELEIQKASEQEARSSSEIADLRRQLSVAAEGKDRELAASKRYIQRLELRINELEEQLRQDEPDRDKEGELSIVRRDLADARTSETKYLQREAAQKETIRQLKRKIVDLERNLHEAEISKLVVDSPRSSVGSARKNEISEVRGQLAEALQQVKELKTKFKETERDAHNKLLAADRVSQAKISTCEHEKDNLEQELRDCRDGLKEQTSRNTSAEQAIGKLRTKVQRLEKELRDAKLGNGDRTIAEERKDLHDMLKEAKIEVEDLQFQIGDRDDKIESLTMKEKDLRSQLKRIREERFLETRKAHAATSELQTLQHRYERALDKAAQIQSAWEAERKAVSQRVRFPNTSISSVRGESTEQLELEVARKEQRHQGEIKGLVKQIQYLRSKCHREETFRADLSYAKKFFLMQIELYDACNHADLRMIEEIGISPDRSIRERRPRMRSVIWLVVSCVRMRRMQQEWGASKKLHASLAKTMEQVRRRSRRGIVI